jgi:hypothetical protein
MAKSFSYDKRWRDHVGSVSLNPVFRYDPPKLLFWLPPEFSTAGAPGAVADVTPDHQRFLILMPTARSALDEISVVMNWPAAIKR